MKKIFWKIFLTYIFALCLINFLRIGFIDQIFISKVPIFLLMIINFILFFIGLPIPLVLDILLINHYGRIYIIFFPIIIGLVSTFHVYLFRRNNWEFILWNNLIKKSKRLSWISNIRIRLNSLNILLIRSLPILPFLFGNYVIASSKLNIPKIFGLNILGSYFYFLTLNVLITSQPLIRFLN